MKELVAAQNFLYDGKELQRLVKQQNYQRIKVGNFKGLNLSDISICLQGDIAIAQDLLSEYEQNDEKSKKDFDRSLNDLRQKIDELTNILAIVDD